jgi:lipopolysaccharide/colanic/teichoic acid biosynthesis glycosyltransferase
LPTPTDYNLTEIEAPLAPQQAAPRMRRERPLAVRPLRPRHIRWYLPCKHVVDFVLAFILFVPALLLTGLAALLVRLSSRGPAFYTQVRVGRNGRLFTIYKIRSMIDNCESLTGPRWSIPGDPRVTPVGWFLRKSHLDELPQLLNVLRGEMSLIGPRPERPEFLPELEQAMPAYRLRLQVRPGVTGLAQIQLPADSDVESVRRKLAYDLYYIERMNPWLDSRLLFATVFYALRIPFRFFGRFLGLPTGRTIETAMRDYVAEPAPARARAAA